MTTRYHVLQGGAAPRPVAKYRLTARRAVDEGASSWQRMPAETSGIAPPPEQLYDSGH